MARSRYIPILSIVLALVLASVNPANAFTYWSNRNGSAGLFDWSDGGSDNALFGSPTLVGGNTFVFFPSGFRAESSDGGSVSVSDRLEVILIAHTGYKFTGIQISENGDYGSLGPGEVEINGLLSAHDQLQSRSKTGSITSTPSSPITMAGSTTGNWSALASVDFTSDMSAWTQLKLEVENELIAISQSGSTAFIEKKVVGAPIAVTIIPEPATLMLLVFGALAMFSRRRRLS